MFSEEICAHILGQLFAHQNWQLIGHKYDRLTDNAGRLEIRCQNDDRLSGQFRFLIHNLSKTEECVYRVLQKGHLLPPHLFLPDTKTIVLENYDNYHFVDRKSMDKHHLQCILDALAKFHAFLHQNEETHWKTVIKNTIGGDILIAKEKLDFEGELKGNFNQIFEGLLDPKEKSVGFGNLDLNDLLFRVENGRAKECVILKFSLHTMPKYFDVLSVIYNEGLRTDSVNEFVDYYYFQLQNELQYLGQNTKTCDTFSEFKMKSKELRPAIEIILALRKITQNNDNIPSVMEEIEDILFVSSIITKEDCEKIMSNKLQSPNYLLLDYNLVPFDKREGFLGEHYTLVIKCRTTSQTSEGKIEKMTFFVKAMPKTASQRDFVEDSGAFIKEFKFFDTLLPLLNRYKINILDAVVPRCFLLCERYVVLQNLKAEGFASPGPQAALDLDSTKLGLSSMAKLHASCLILEELIGRENGRPYRIVDDQRSAFSETFYNDKRTLCEAFVSCKHGFRALVDVMYENEQCDRGKQEFLEFLLNGVDDQKIFGITSNCFRNTICHGDLWWKNTMFNGGNSPKCMIVDFQTYRYAPPGQDFLAFMHLNTRRELRNRFLNSLADFYYYQLNNNLACYGLGALISRDEFQTTLRYYKQFALIQAVTHFQTVMCSETTVNEMFLDPDYVQYVFFENKYDFTRKLCREDPIFNERLRECMQDLREFFDEMHHEDTK